MRSNAKKTEVMTFNVEGNVRISIIDGLVIEVKDDFKFLGPYVSSTEKEIRVRKAQACRALHDLKNIWKSAMSDNVKRALFRASDEPILLYGSETGTLTMNQEARPNGCYICMEGQNKE